jgi:hypothetical protein
MQQSQIFGYNRLLVRYRFYLALRISSAIVARITFPLPLSMPPFKLRSVLPLALPSTFAFFKTNRLTFLPTPP